MLGRTEREKQVDDLAEVKVTALKQALLETKGKLDPKEHQEAIAFINEQLENLDDVTNKFETIRKLDHILQREKSDLKFHI